MANVWARDRAKPFYLVMGLLGLAAVLFGFSTTYTLPMARGTFAAPWVVHLHGFLALSWLGLFLAQSWLVSSGRTRAHRAVGKLGMPLALAVLASGVGTGVWASQRDFPRFGEDAVGGLTGTITSLLLFSLLVGAAILLRRRPDWHKRLMLLATVVVLWPAYFRLRHLLPFVPRPEFWLALVLADLPILVAAIRDRLRYGRVHPAWAWVGTGVFLEQTLEIWLFGSPQWNAFGRWALDALT